MPPEPTLALLGTALYGAAAAWFTITVIRTAPFARTLSPSARSLRTFRIMLVIATVAIALLWVYALGIAAPASPSLRSALVYIIGSFLMLLGGSWMLRREQRRSRGGAR